MTTSIGGYRPQQVSWTFRPIRLAIGVAGSTLWRGAELVFHTRDGVASGRRTVFPRPSDPAAAAAATDDPRRLAHPESDSGPRLAREDPRTPHQAEDFHQLPPPRRSGVQERTRALRR